MDERTTALILLEDKIEWLLSQEDIAVSEEIGDLLTEWKEEIIFPVLHNDTDTGIVECGICHAVMERQDAFLSDKHTYLCGPCITTAEEGGKQ